MSDEWTSLWLTFKLAACTTMVLLVLAAPLAWWLSRPSKGVSRWLKLCVEVISSVPLVLPPTVIGFYLLILLSPNQGFGKWLLENFNLQLVFSFSGLVLASMVYSLPFMVQPLLDGFLQWRRSMDETAMLLGASVFKKMRFLVLPFSRPFIITASTLTFAHTIGEFGIVLMIGGSIPGETKVASIALFEHVESLNYSMAHELAVILLVTSVALLFIARYFRTAVKL